MHFYSIDSLHYLFFQRTGQQRRDRYYSIFNLGRNGSIPGLCDRKYNFIFPFGFLLPVALSLFRKWQWSLFAHIGFSCGLEFMQMVTKRGFCQTDDILTNALGGMMGFWFFTLLLQHIQNESY